MTVGALSAVIPAAGGGTRMGSGTPKLYRPLAGRTVLEWSLAPLLAQPAIERIVVALSAGDTQFERLPLATDERVCTVLGGSSRAASVRAGLAALDDRPDLEPVLVHDGARPCLSTAELDRLLATTGDPDGALLAVPVRDTLKRATPDGRVAATEDRTDLWHALTPQLFPLAALRAALDVGIDAGAGAGVTDEASAMELSGHAPRLVEGDPANIKITRELDLPLAAAVLALREGVSEGQWNVEP